MAFKDDLKLALGFPQIRVELSEDPASDDFALLAQRTLRVIRPYFPKEYIINCPAPMDAGSTRIDLASHKFMAITNVYVLKSPNGNKDILLPWSTARIWEQAWLGKSDFMGTELLFFQNTLKNLNQITNNKFGWHWAIAEQALYVTHVPSFAIGLGVTGLKGIESLDDLDPLDIVYEYALRYAIALGKQKLGHLWRKYAVAGVEMPGASVVDEGRTEEKETMTDIENNAVYPGGFAS